MNQSLKSGIKLFFIVSIIVIITIIAGIWLLQPLQLDLVAQILSQQTEIIDDQSSTSVQNYQSPIDISNWQTYRNDAFEFEIKYPNGWNVQNFVSARVVKISNNQTGSTFAIVKNDNPDSVSLDEWFRRATLTDGRATIKASAGLITINGVRAYELKEDFEVVAIADNQRNIFSMYGNYENKEDVAVHGQILSTFRFVE